MKTNYPGNLGGNDRRYNRNQNTYDQGMTNRGPGMYRKPGTNRNKKYGQDSDAALTEGISAVKEYLKEIAELQKRLVGSQEQIAKAQQTHAGAMQQIADCVKQFLGNDTAAPSATESSETQPTVSQSTAPENEPAEDIAAVSESEPEEARSLPEETPPETEASADTPMAPAGTPTGRSAEAALKIIAEMRGNRVSFEKIADHLEAESIPMVSGNGKWNRRIVSKVYKDSV